MSRFVWPQAFLLFDAPLNEAVRTGKAEEAARFIESGCGVSGRPSGPFGTPVALRWVSTPGLGFPRQPFKVYRRQGDFNLEFLRSDTLSVDGSVIVEWDMREMYEVIASASAASGETLIIEALDARREEIPGQRISLKDMARPCRFRSPGIAALRATGKGTIFSVRAADQAVVVNDPAWELIEVTGFPFGVGEVSLPVYNPLPQGPVPAALTGLEAAKCRLEIARILHLSPPATGLLGIPTPAWPPPDVARYLQILCDGAPSPLKLIRECLLNSDDADLFRMQVFYKHQATLAGAHQPDLDAPPTGSDPTIMGLPVVAVTMLAAGNDSYAATGLGYGTVDFPPPDPVPQPPGNIVDPPGTVRTAFDYMVTAEFRLPLIGTFELAALARTLPDPEPVTTLLVSTKRINRASAKDRAATEAVELRWNLSPHPQGYVVAVSPSLSDVRVLNAPHPVAGGFTPFIPTRPDSEEGVPPLDAFTSFIDPIAPLPLFSIATSRYVVIGLDVFGRWSPSWRSVAHTVPAPPITTPGLHSVEIILPSEAADRIVSCDLQIEFSWDWSDRSADRVEFTGKFFPAGGSPPAAFLDGFALSVAGPVGDAVVVQFDVDGNPSIVSGHDGTVETLTSTFTPPSPDDPDQRKYRLTLHGFSCDFTDVSELAFAVYARGAERIRSSELSATVGPRVAQTHDPLPPRVPPLPVDLRWTALPDAAGRARGVLRWPASPYAVGYVVWEATESALRHILGAIPPELPPGTPLLERATKLQAIINAGAESKARSLEAFARLNTDPIRGTQFEVELPGNASTIYAYRVSAVNAANVESERSSTIALFAVPRRNQPGQPRLILRNVKPSGDLPNGGIRVIALPGPGPKVAGYQVYRVRNAGLLSDVGLKGPPKIEHDAAGWDDFTFETLNGNEQGRAIVDQGVCESWYPYYYQIVALGEEDVVAGEYRGESIPSTTQPGFLPPRNPPLLKIVSFVGNAFNRVVTFRTNLPVKPTALGRAMIEVLQLVFPDDLRRFKRMRLISLAADEVEVGPPLVVIPPSPVPIDTKINRRETGPDGVTEFTVRVKSEVAQGIVVVRDPLGRTVEAQFPEAP